MGRVARTGPHGFPARQGAEDEGADDEGADDEGADDEGARDGGAADGKPMTGRLGRAAILVAGVAAALAVRWPLLPHETWDTVASLGPWYEFIAANGYFAALQHEFSTYSPAYHYLQALTALAAPGLSPLLGVKALSIAFDFVLAFFVAQCVGLRFPHSNGRRLAAFLATLFLPTVVLNAAFWGQADSIHTAFLAACLYFLLAGRQGWAFAAFGLAFSVKLQAVFLAPLFLWLLARKAVEWRHFFWGPLVWFLSLLPAWFVGRPLGELLTVYLGQATQYGALTRNAQNLYQWAPESFFPAWPLFAALAAAVLAAIAVPLHRSRLRITPERIVFLSTFSLLLAPYLLPKMHDRYFFPAEVVSLVLAFYAPRFWYAPALLVSASSLHYLRQIHPAWWAPESWVAVPLGLLLLVLARRFVLDLEPADGIGTFPRSRAFRALAGSRLLPGALLLATLAIPSLRIGQWAYARQEAHRAQTARLEALREAIRSGDLDPPLRRSTFDLYLDGKQLVYYREPCEPADTEARFLLYFHPPAGSDNGAAPGVEIRQRNRDFDFEEQGRRLDGACVAAVALPESGTSGIAAIETGQWDGSRRTWRAVRRLDLDRFRSALDSIASGAVGEPLVRSAFDLYRVGSELAYHRRDCAPEEVEARFFLHLFPPEDPAGGARRSFENHDFDFEERGLELDGDCLALVRFPADGIAAARTGQWVAGAAPSWEAALRLDRDRFRARLDSLASGAFGEPLARSTFDLYLGETELLYHRERCAAADLEGRFFVHLAPAARVPREERDAFGSREFAFGERGVRTADGECLAIFPLDPRKTASIETGQHRGRTPLWRTGLRLGPDGRAAPAGSAGPTDPGEPVHRSVFDLRYDGTTLTYLKKPCTTHDTNARFFLHLVPADPAVLPGEAASAGFENRDFAFPDYGLHLDGECRARVPLPPYPISRIRTGQFVTDGGRLWEAELSPGDGRGRD